MYRAQTNNKPRSPRESQTLNKIFYFIFFVWTLVLTREEYGLQLNKSNCAVHPTSQHNSTMLHGFKLILTPQRLPVFSGEGAHSPLPHFECTNCFARVCAHTVDLHFIWYCNHHVPLGLNHPAYPEAIQLALSGVVSSWSSTQAPTIAYIECIYAHSSYCLTLFIPAGTLKRTYVHLDTPVYEQIDSQW